ncbi:MAG: hypothetical protein RR063_08320 [Anaerovoracaceae bacterium]
MERISINDIEKLVLHADEVLTQIRFSRFFYNDNGDYNSNADKENPADEKYLDFIRPNPILRFSEANSATLEEIKKEYLQPHLALALSLFRKGVLGMPYYVDASVSDEYLITLLTIRCKDVLRIFAIQKEP